MSNIRRLQLDDAFEGFDEDTTFHLSDGTFWIQDEYKYWYHYAYRPQIELVRERGAIYLRLAGRKESVRVRELAGVIESQIEGEFEGWQGESKYELTNGQIWKQREYRYEYRYAYRPHVLIYDTPQGTVMNVEGCKAVVERIR